MFARFKCRYSAKCGSSVPRSHRHKAVLSPVALTPSTSCGAKRRQLHVIVMGLYAIRGTTSLAAGILSARPVER